MREYLLAVTVAALVSAIATKLIKNGTIAAVLRLICGIFMAITVVSPWLSIRFDELQDIATIIWADGSGAAQSGENLARETMSQYIIQQTQAYILDKAEALGVSLDVQVSISEEELPVPIGVKLSGAVSPYARSVLTQYISDNLGIDTEDQIWIQS